MNFKQGVLREEKIKFFSTIIGASVPYIALAIGGLIRQEDLKCSITFLLVIFLPVFSLLLLFGLVNLEWFYIYEDRIEARYIFGIKNIVYFDNVLYVQKMKINLTVRGMEKEFYIFNDGRNNNKNIFNINSCYNKKKFNFRIYRTTELDNYINIKNLETVKTGDGGLS